MSAITWATGISGDWSDATDWAPQQSPGSSDSVGIGPGIGGSTTYTVTATNELAAALLIATGGFGTLSVSDLLDVGGPLTVASGSLVVQPGGTVASSGALTLGQAGDTASQGTLSADGSGLIAALSLGLYDGSTLALGSAAVALGNGASNAFGVTVGSNTSLTGDAGTIEGGVVSAGSIDILAVRAGESPGGLTITVGLVATAGQIDIAAGATLAVGGEMTLSYETSLTIGAGAVLTVGSLLAVSGTLSDAEARITAGQLFLNSVTLVGGSLTQTGASAGTITGDLLLTSAAALTAPQLVLGQSEQWMDTVEMGGALGISGALTVQGEPLSGLGGGPPPPVTLLVAAGGSVTVEALDVLGGSTIALTGSGTMAVGNAAPVAGLLGVGGNATLDGGWGAIAANVALAGTLSETAEGNTFAGGPPSPSLGVFTIAGSLTGQGVIVLGDGTEPTLAGPYSVTPTLTIADAVGFAGSLTLDNGSLVVLGTADMPAAPITVRLTDATTPATSDSATVDLAALDYEAFNLPLYAPATGLLTVGPETLDVGLGRSQSDFSTQPDTGTGTDVRIAISCFAAGTRLLGEHGEIAVEALAPGDHVYTPTGRLAPVRWVGFREVACRRHPRPAEVSPVRIAAHAFGPGRPHRDLFLSPDHAVFFDDVLIPVRHLIDGVTIAQQVAETVTYWHVELDRHDVVLAENLPCESFLDTGSRAAFANGGACVQLHPDFSQRLWDADSVAPLVVAGPLLARVRTRLRARRRRAA